MSVSIEVSYHELILLIQLVVQHASIVNNDPSKAHLLEEGNPKKADLELTAPLLQRLLAVNNTETLRLGEEYRRAGGKPLTTE